jgi:nitrite reductase (cytochrome c-552)
VRSPLLNINNACQTCHSRSEQALLAQAEEIQARHAGLTEVALDALVDLIDDLAGAKGDGVSDEQLAEALGFQRRASFYVDWVDAENSTGFHAPQEAARVLGMSIDFSRRGQIALRDALGSG